MIKLNRTTEYGLIALRHISRKSSSQPASAREIADFYGLPFEITAKTLQRLKDTDLIHSAQGSRGGYTLRRPLTDVTLAEFIQLMEGPQGVVACTSEKVAGARPVATKPAVGAPCDCSYHVRCEIRNWMEDLNQRVLEFLAGIRLSDLGNNWTPAHVRTAEEGQKWEAV